LFRSTPFPAEGKNKEADASDKRGHEGSTGDTISVERAPIETVDEDFSIPAS
jgi:hypothetical protein